MNINIELNYACSSPRVCVTRVMDLSQGTAEGLNESRRGHKSFLPVFGGDYSHSKPTQA